MDEGSRINRNPFVSRTAMNVEEISNEEKCRSGHVTGAAIGPGFLTRLARERFNVGASPSVSIHDVL